MYHWIFWICLFFIIIEINHLGKFPFISIRGILQNCNISSPKVSSRSQPVSPFLLGCQEVFTSPTPKFVAGVLYLSSMFFYSTDHLSQTHQVGHHHFAFHIQQMTRWQHNFTICIIDGFSNQSSWVDYNLDFCKQLFRDSSSKLLLQVLRRDDKMLLADLVCLSQTPPKWLAKGGYFFSTQSNMHSDWALSSGFCYDSSPL